MGQFGQPGRDERRVFGGHPPRDVERLAAAWAYSITVAVFPAPPIPVTTWRVARPCVCSAASKAISGSSRPMNSGMPAGIVHNRRTPPRAVLPGSELRPSQAIPAGTRAARATSNNPCAVAAAAPNATASPGNQITARTHHADSAFDHAFDDGAADGRRRWLYPLITDGLALLAYTATARLTGGATRYAWSVVVLAAGLSGFAQASYLAGGATLDAPPALRFGVGA